MDCCKCAGLAWSPELEICKALVLHVVFFSKNNRHKLVKPASLRAVIEGPVVKWLRHNVFVITFEGSNPSGANNFF